jgi:hypothetical protein
MAKKKLKSCQFENYEVLEIAREQIKNAPYNPRKIDKKNREKLRKNLDRKKGGVGLIEPIVWNRRTGNIVSGHQRVSILDELEGTYEYTLRVSAVDLDDKQEKEQNIFMNNRGAQGEFDADIIEGMLKAGEIDIDKAGIDMAEIMQGFGDDILNQQEAIKLNELSSTLQKYRDQFDKIKGRSDDTNDTDFYFVVVFKNQRQRAAVAAALGVVDNKFVDGREVARLCDIDLDAV